MLSKNGDIIKLKQENLNLKKLKNAYQESNPFSKNSDAKTSLQIITESKDLDSRSNEILKPNKNVFGIPKKISTSQKEGDLSEVQSIIEKKSFPNLNLNTFT